MYVGGSCRLGTVIVCHSAILFAVVQYYLHYGKCAAASSVGLQIQRIIL